MATQARPNPLYFLGDELAALRERHPGFVEEFEKGR